MGGALLVLGHGGRSRRGHMARARALAAAACALCAAPWPLSLLISWLFSNRPSWLLPPPAPPGNSSTPASNRVSTNT